MDDTLNRLGITDQILPKVKPGGTGAVVKGDVDFALAFQPEINDPGVDIVRPLPAGVSTPTPMVVVISSHAKNPAIAKSLAGGFPLRSSCRVLSDIRGQVQHGFPNGRASHV